MATPLHGPDFVAGAARGGTTPLISVAPMMNCTDRHCRFFLRQLAPGVRLYTEMLTAQAIVFGDRGRLLEFDAGEHPVGVQLAGNDARLLAEAARIVAARGYDEVNLNLGCPSSRVQSGRFGACLMTDAGRVADCVTAMREAVMVPVSVKIRTGVDDHDSYEFLANFVQRLAAAGCRTFIVHARKAVLAGLSPGANLRVPSLQYPMVYQLKRDFPRLTVHINGGISTLAAIARHLEQADGVMIGRKAYEDPYFLTTVQARFLNAGHGADPPAPARSEVLRRMVAYARRQQEQGVRLHQITRHLLGLFHGVPGARSWRRFITVEALRPDGSPELLLRSLALVPGVV
jgi:tRNA-dihydrouridine synthase A